MWGKVLLSSKLWSSSPNVITPAYEDSGWSSIIGHQLTPQTMCRSTVSNYICIASKPSSVLLTTTGYLKMPKRILCSYGVDIDAVAGWLGSYGGEDSPNDISRGLFAGTHGTRRMLKLFEKYNIKATWFIPGHTLETFPEECAMVRDAGHEIGLHGTSIKQGQQHWNLPDLRAT